LEEFGGGAGDGSAAPGLERERLERPYHSRGEYEGGAAGDCEHEGSEVVAGRRLTARNLHRLTCLCDGALEEAGGVEVRHRLPQLDTVNPAVLRLRASSRSCSPSRSPLGSSSSLISSICSSPRGAGQGPAGELASSTGRSMARSLAIISLAIVALAAASVPKLTRMDIDVDIYSPMIREGDCKLNLDSLARPRHVRRPPFAAASSSSSASDVFATAGKGKEDHNNGRTSLRLRGGKNTPHFTPSQSSCDLRGGCGRGPIDSETDECTVATDFVSAGRRYRPKLSRTIDAH